MNNLKTCVLAVLLVNGDLFKDREHLLWSDPFNEELLKFSRNSDGSRRLANLGQLSVMFSASLSSYF